MSERKQFLLSSEERRAPVWLSLVEHLKTRLEDLRTRNDGDRSEVETAKIRGQIMEIKSLIALDRDI